MGDGPMHMNNARLLTTLQGEAEIEVNTYKEFRTPSESKLTQGVPLFPK